MNGKLNQRTLQLERDLLHARKLQALGLLASGMAHDFNNVLAAISGYSELLKRRFGSLDPDIARYSEVILESCLRASQMVDRLKLFTRKDRRKETLIDAHPLLEELKEVVAFTLPSRYRVSWDLGASSHWFSGDPNLFQGAVLHLLILGREVLPKGGNITIRTSNLSQRMLDGHNHPAMVLDLVSSDEKLDWAVLDRVVGFQGQAGELTEAEFAGLHVMGEYMESQGGFLKMERVGTGSIRVRLVFALSLLKDPMESLDEENQAVLSKNPVVAEPCRVVVVDDDPAVQEVLETLLKACGVECQSCEDLQGVKEVLGSGSIPHMALIDQHLDGEDGLQICEWMQKHYPGIKLGLMTGYVGEMDQRVLLTRGIHLFEKPFDLNRLKSWVSQKD